MPDILQLKLNFFKEMYSEYIDKTVCQHISPKQFFLSVTCTYAMKDN